MTHYHKNLSEPWFSFTEIGLKTVEGRLNRGDFLLMNVGDTITFTNDYLGLERQFSVRIVEIRHYETFRLYLEKEGLRNCLPGIDTMEKGLNVYSKIYSEEDERAYQVIALHIQKIQQ